VGPRTRRQFDLFGRAPSFRTLFFAALASGLGTWLAFVALTIDVWDRTHSGTWVSALLIADFLPSIAVGLVLAPVVDRFSRRRLMIGADVFRFAVFCTLPFAHDATTIVLLAAAAGIATAFFRPAVYAGLPNLVSDADLPRANSLLQTAENVTTTAGPVAGGILVAATSPHAAYWINAVTFVVSAALLTRIPAKMLQSVQSLSKGHLRDIAAGLRLIRRSRALLTVLVVWNMVMVANAGINVAEVVLAKVSFHSGDFGFGLLVAAAGLGLAIGSFLAGPLLERRRPGEMYGGSIALMALGFGGAAIAPNVWVAAFCVVVSGVGNGAAVVCNALFVQRGAPDELRGRVFTVLMSSTYVLLGLGMAVAGPLTNAVGPRWVWGAAAAITAVAAGTGLALARGIGTPDRAAAAPTPVPVPSQAGGAPQEREAAI
jgi:DHA3 family macrolide efflux protein-like MFS transporter